MNEGWGRRQQVAIAVACALAAIGLWVNGSEDVWSLAYILVAVAAAGSVAWLVPSKPAAAFGILFLVATLSRWSISTPFGNMRLEQPAILAGYAALLLAPSRRDLPGLRRLWPIGASFALYLACLAASSVLFAPDRADSLRITFWTGLSMSGGLLAFLLLAMANAQATGWIRLSGLVQALAGIAFALLFFTLGPVLVTGPTAAPGVQDALSSLPRVFALSWEANLYASLLAALIPFGIDRLLTRGRTSDKVLVVTMAVGLALGETRGAYLGLAAGVAVYVLLAFAPRRRWATLDIPRVGIRAAVVVASLAGGLLVAGVLMQGGRPPTKPLDFTLAGWGRGLFASATGQPEPSPGASGTTATPSPSPSPTPTPTYTVAPPPDTVGFRLDRVAPALADLPHSPLIGLGANSFGQRHPDPSQPGQPDHIAILALAALYESGALGAAGLAIGFGLVLLTLLRAARHRADRGAIAAYAGALACLLVAYQATNALNFSLIWLIAGAGLAAAYEPLDRSLTE
ncbi:MAG: O-antigen ligase family protein [Candidatus Limnocylindrales bacterium]